MVKDQLRVDRQLDYLIKSREGKLNTNKPGPGSIKFLSCEITYY